MVTQMQYDSTSESKDRRISADVKTGVPGAEFTQEIEAVQALRGEAAVRLSQDHAEGALEDASVRVVHPLGEHLDQVTGVRILVWRLLE